MQCYYYPRDDAQSVVSVAIGDIVVTDLQLDKSKFTNWPSMLLTNYYH